LGWPDVLERRDTVAAEVADLAWIWDSGEDRPKGAMAHIDPTRPARP